MKRKHHKYKTIDNLGIDMSNWHDSNPHPISHFLFLAIGVFLGIAGLSSGVLFFAMVGMGFFLTGMMGFKEDFSITTNTSSLFGFKNGDDICNPQTYIEHGEIDYPPYKPIYKNKKYISAAQANKEIDNIKKFYTGTYRPLNGQKEKCPFYDTPHYIKQ